MSEQKGRKIIPSGGGFFNNLTQQVKLILRLMGDSRVSPFLKLLPIGSVAYFLIPDLVLGPLDDMAVLWLGAYLFVELCPPDIVEEHRAALRRVRVPGEWHDSDQEQEEVIDGEFWEKKN